MHPQAQLIRGFPASSGCCQGRALVVGRPDDLAGFARGDIIVAAAPLPEYGGILHNAGALLAGGGLLSRLLTVARAVGIPAVVALPDAFSSIATGDELVLDGDRGLVEVVPRNLQR